MVRKNIKAKIGAEKTDLNIFSHCVTLKQEKLNKIKGNSFSQADQVGAEAYGVPRISLFITKLIV